MGGEINFVSLLIFEYDNDGGNQHYEYQQNGDEQVLIWYVGDFSVEVHP